ncbi:MULTISPECIES: hypothetical protein [unclassified Streptomyces]|uniref:hypothetical protein n=1 Tax=unclassified Streptomyces TaxID=2593676 RepID=UPI001661850F|nr:MULTISPECIES: hypothetical protein [unclassified Streptomyces]
MSRLAGRMRADRRVRRVSTVLALGAVAGSGLGAVAESIWLLGAGAWLLISAVLLELVYRP